MEATHIELVAYTQDFTDAQVTRAAEAFLEVLGDGKSVIEMDARRENFPVVLRAEKLHR